MNAIKPLGGIFDFDIKKSRLDQISKELEDPSIWNDQGRSQTLGKEKRELDFIVNGLSNLASNLKDQCDLFELARTENDTRKECGGDGIPSYVLSSYGSE